jgi:cell division protease FtsH
MNGSQLENLVNEAALMAARQDKKTIHMEDLEQAKDKVMMGPERKSAIVSEKDRRRTAYHEAGHAIVSAVLPDSDKVHKVTITPRGMAMGLTWFLPEERSGSTVEEFRARIAMAMGGRAAEEVVLSEISTGAANDLQQATHLARDMVCKYGMSEVLGPVSWDDGGGEVFLGRDFSRRTSYSETTAKEIDNEIRGMVQEGYRIARSILLANIHILHRIAQMLLEKETVEGEEFHSVVASMNPVLPEGAGAMA